MAQTGDPTGTGTGGSDLPNIPAEFSAEPFKRGTIGMARSQDPDFGQFAVFHLLRRRIVFEPQIHSRGPGRLRHGCRRQDQERVQARQWHGDRPDKIVKMQIAADAAPHQEINSPQGYAGKRPRFLGHEITKLYGCNKNVKGIVQPDCGLGITKFCGWIPRLSGKARLFPADENYCYSHLGDAWRHPRRHWLSRDQVASQLPRRKAPCQSPVTAAAESVRGAERICLNAIDFDQTFSQFPRVRQLTRGILILDHHEFWIEVSPNSWCRFLEFREGCRQNSIPAFPPFPNWPLAALFYLSRSRPRPAVQGHGALRSVPSRVVYLGRRIVYGQGLRKPRLRSKAWPRLAIH